MDGLVEMLNRSVCEQYRRRNRIILQYTYTVRPCCLQSIVPARPTLFLFRRIVVVVKWHLLQIAVQLGRHFVIRIAL